MRKITRADIKATRLLNSGMKLEYTKGVKVRAMTRKEAIEILVPFLTQLEKLSIIYKLTDKQLIVELPKFKLI